MSDRRDAEIREQVDRLGRPDEELLDREIARQSRIEAYGRLLAGVAAILLATAAVIVIVTNLWLAVLRIDGHSMTPLLTEGEIVVALRDGKCGRNDVIAFYQCNGLHVKRVIAIGGDTVDIDEQGFVSVNGMTLGEPYVSELSYGNGDIVFPFDVPNGAFFVLGDNRPLSLDSRDSAFGTVSAQQVVGRVILRLWPLAALGS